MKLTNRWTWLIGLVGIVATVVDATGTVAAEPPAPPKVSTFASAKDVTGQIQA